MKIKIWKEWYDIILKLSETRKEDLSKTIDYISNTKECLNLSRVKTSKLKEINVNLDKEISDKEIERKIEKFLFCD
ncbi:hypothetical protein [Acidianus manzaensis]|uniref:Uncharacterized protein n=1 Tax=Acidianus manzaensis TaxID=282676 RepID=A0A1W6K152_9CREN|nr:hypothetical protein [Acidianus manzaensis]ARM76225.1 hypothetical protein B6F84_09440 [Acidianus manzaensis]